jgi:hypothetical protein
LPAVSQSVEVAPVQRQTLASEGRTLIYIKRKAMMPIMPIKKKAQSRRAMEYFLFLQISLNQEDFGGSGCI